MSIIVPAGKKNVNWSPKDKVLTKIASTEGVEGVEEVESDPLLEAAMGALETKKAATEVCEDCECDPCECEGKETKEAMGCMDEGVVELEVEEVSNEESEEAGSVADAVKAVEDKAEAAEAKIEAVVEAIDQIEEAVEGVREVCVEISDVEEESEGVEEVELDIEVEDEGGEDIIVESEPEEVMASGKKLQLKEASTEEFCKFAMLSKVNKKKLADYWINMLNYPKDYVDLMTKTYEK